MFRIPAHLQRSPLSGVFYFRLTVPEHLRHTIGKREIKKSLRTGLKSEAQILAQKYYYDSKLLFLKAEQKMSKDKKNPDPYSPEWIKQNAPWGWSIGKAEKEKVDDVLENSDSSEDEEPSVDFITIKVKGVDGSTNDVVIDYDGDAEKELNAASQLLGINNNPVTQTKPASKSKDGEVTIRLAGMIRDCLRENKQTGSWTPKTYEENSQYFSC